MVDDIIFPGEPGHSFEYFGDPQPETTAVKGEIVEKSQGSAIGRPKKSEARALTELLRMASGGLIELPDGTKIERREYVAHALWDLVTYGSVTLLDGGSISVHNWSAWFEVTKWLYGQLDGPPKPELPAGLSPTAPVVIVLDR